MKAVLFDLDRTLLDRDAAVAGFAGQIWAGSGTQDDDQSVRFVSRMIQLDARGRGDKRAMFGSLVAEFLPMDDAEALRVKFELTFPATVTPFDDAQPLLEALRRQGVQTGVVSNGRANFQRAKLAHSGLLPLLDVVVISEAAGCKKPDPRIFRLALDALGCPAEAAIFVGDSEETDVRGAKSAGMFAVLRRYATDNFATEAQAEIASLSGLLPIIHAAIKPVL